LKWFKNQRISRKLIIGFLIVAVIAAVVGVIGLTNILNMNNSDKILYEQNTLGLQYSGSMAVNLQQLRYDMFKLTTLEDTEEINSIKTEVGSLRTTLEDLLLKCDETILTDHLKATLDEIDAKWSNYDTDIDEYFKLAEAGNKAKATDLVMNTLAPTGIEIRDLFLKLFDDVAAEAAGRSESNANEAQNATITMIIVVAAGIALSVVLGVYISRIIGKLLLKMAEIADRLAVGDVDVAIEADSRDEGGRLADAFDKLVKSTKQQVKATQMIASGDLTTEIEIRSNNDLLGRGLTDLVDNLNHLVITIVNASEQVASGSGLVSNSSMALSQGATEQASSVQELTASIDEIASQTNLNAQNAENANKLARSARENAVNGNAQMKEMLKAMDEINVASANINKIIKVIDDIAFQTNILALNAAVEAARAGQHGKGFAVVAEEVRTLAARSANAVKETTEMIEGSIRKVEAGTKIAKDTAEALGKIVDEVEKAADLVGNIAKASTEQASSISQVNQGIVQVSQVVQTNAATAEESAAASEELSSQAVQLKETISIFKIKKSVGMSASAENAVPQKKSSIHNNSGQLTAKTGSAAGAVRAKIALDDGEFGKY
jgi:methyl-accepting chemotaxis protein